MKTAILHTEQQDKTQTLGNLSTDNFTCKTIERGWNDNQNDISCIPAGEYLCKYTRSNRLSQVAGHDVFTYEVLNVPNRAGIRIHAANYSSQLRGCISPGASFSDINKDGLKDVTDSRNTLAKFEQAMNHEDFKLIVIRPA